MFERFSDQARHVVVLAQEEARLLDHNYIGTEHLLLGLFRAGDSRATRALDGLDLSLETVRANVVEIVGRGGPHPAGHIPFTPRAKRALELSLREAMMLQHTYIGPEHILLGLLAEGEGVAAIVLTNHGADADTVRRTLEASPAAAEGVPMFQEPLSVQTIPMPMRSPTGGCSVCHRDLWDVRRYVQGEQGAICEDCARSAVRALEVMSPSERVVHMPPRVASFTADPVDPDVADAITATVEAAFDPARVGDEKAAFIESLGHLQPYMQEAAQRAPEYQVTGVHVTHIRLRSPDEADVRFVVEVANFPTGFPSEGSVSRRGSTWQVTWETIAQMVARAGVHVPPPGER